MTLLLLTVLFKFKKTIYLNALTANKNTYIITITIIVLPIFIPLISLLVTIYSFCYLFETKF